MIRRLFIIGGSLFFLGVLALFIARMSRSVHVQAQQTAFSQTVTNQYGTFTDAVIVAYDPNGGSGDGESYITEQLTGRPSSFMPGGVLHTPSATVHLAGNGYKQTGNGVPANQSPNFSRTWSFDMFADCDQQFLDTGFCVGDGEANDWCPIAGVFFLNFLHGMEAEDAITNFFVPAHSNVGSKYTCSNNPPDWIGLFNAPDFSDVDRTFRASTVCWRICNNPPCTNTLWTCPGPAKKSKTIPATPVQNCTQKDKGFITGQNVIY